MSKKEEKKSKKEKIVKKRWFCRNCGFAWAIDKSLEKPKVCPKCKESAVIAWRRKPKKIGYFGLAPIRRLAHDMGYKRIAHGVLEDVNRELEQYARLILNGCGEGSKTFKRTTITKKDLFFAFTYVVQKPSRA